MTKTTEGEKIQNKTEERSHHRAKKAVEPTATQGFVLIARKFLITGLQIVPRPQKN